MESFHKATKKSTNIKILFTGPSGSGKTYSALKVATGLGKKIALIDTENASASLYSDKFNFDIMELYPPFEINKYTAAIGIAEMEKYDVLIIDSITHAWSGEGGLLQKKESLDRRGGNSWANWAGITKEHEAFKAKLLQAKIHIIATARSKTEWVVSENEKGKKVPQKIGLTPDQRAGIEFES